jgi:hypothetical protein
VTGKRKVVLRAEDAIPLLREALLAPKGSPRREALQHQALMTVYFGDLNAHKFSDRGDRRGRPKGTNGTGQKRHKKNDAAALQLMTQIAAEMGESRPYVLAQLAISKGRALSAAMKEIAVRRLGRRWKLHTTKK